MSTKLKGQNAVKSAFCPFCWIYFLFILYTLPTLYVFKHFHRHSFCIFIQLINYRFKVVIFVTIERHFLCRKEVLYMLVVISFVLGFISSVIAGIVANYISDKLKGSNKNPHISLVGEWGFSVYAKLYLIC